MRVLHLTLKKQWFDMIASGEKKEEYREVKPFWNTRLSKFMAMNPGRNIVEFKNGYGAKVPTMRFMISDVSISHGRTEWGAPEHETVFVISLGERVS